MNIRRGEIWLINFDPTVGSEIRKKRPAVVISSDSVGILPMRLVVPMTGWKPHFTRNNWMVKVEPNVQNGLSKTSALDTLQMRGLDIKRFISKIGTASDYTLAETVAAIAIAIDQ